MKTIKRVICGLGLMALAPHALAEADQGFYLGVGVGESTYNDLSQDDFDDIVVSSFFEAGAPVTSGNSSFEDSATSLAIFAGYRFNPYIAVEGGYMNLGATEYRFRGQVNPPGPISSVPASLSMDIESTGITLSGIGSIPLGSIFDLHGRLGLFISDTELKVGTTIENSGGSDSEKLDSESVLFGVGGAFHIGNHFTVSLDWTRYDNVGDEDEDDDADTEAGIDIDLLSLSAMFRF
jgi:OmpA-OmpF porin, OOP family